MIVDNRFPTRPSFSAIAHDHLLVFVDLAANSVEKQSKYLPKKFRSQKSLEHTNLLIQIGSLIEAIQFTARNIPQFSRQRYANA